MGSIPERGRGMIVHAAERPLCRAFGTYLGVLYENTAYAGVNGMEQDADASIRVVPPSLRSLLGSGGFFIL